MPDWQFRPARDQNLTPAQRLRSIGREPGLGSHAITATWRTLTWTYLRVAHQFEVEGHENLPPPPFVMVANHASHLDALALAAALPPSLAGKAFALAAGDTFFTSNAKSAFAAYAINALPIWRNKTSARDIIELRRRLHGDGAVLILFPEGTRTRTGEMGPFKPGIGALVAGSAVPVIPCYLSGAFAAWPPASRFPRPSPLHLKIGAPLDFSAAAKDRAALHDLSAQCEQAVRALSRHLRT